MTTETLSWTPHGNHIEMVEVGIHWDAVRAPVTIGERALELLGKATGAVVADYGLMYWLIKRGTAQYWRRLPRVQALDSCGARTAHIGVPPVTHTTGPRLHWRVPVGPDQYLTNATQLRKALAQAVVDELGMDEDGRSHLPQSQTVVSSTALLL
ncbi:hypothetical protein PH213_37395 [Streptomyces sp. SRF1]|uniref:hypothetical protein n=1 Tax=Streptomyces sp. SRF1 TaxID=1549642 RepID=UPI0025AF7E9D|nr:hypothetical protein [Streptomyces sp. SRF1]MDN3060096.1 hypothetical protein [Streptomyces sp. SRF1]